MTPDLVLESRLTQASRRVRGLLVYRWASRTLCWSSVGCLLWLLASKLTWVEEPPLLTLACVMAVAALGGVVVGLAQRLTRADIARLTDERTGLKERLGTAVELSGAPADDALARLQREDAGAHAKDLDLRKVYPVRASREAVVFALAVLAVVLAYWLPTLPIFWSKAHVQEMAAVKKEGLRLEKVARDTDKAATKQQLDESKKAAKELQKLAEAMKRGNLDKKQAMIQMAKLTKQLSERQRQIALGNTPQSKPMEQAAAEIKRAMEDRQKAAEEALRQKEQAKAAAGKKPDAKPGLRPGDKGGPKPGEKQTESMQQAQQALQQFADALQRQDSAGQNEAMQKLAEQLQKGQLTPEEMKTLSQQLQQMAQALKNTNLDKVAKQLQQLAQQMRSIKLDPETLKKMAQMAKQAGGT